VKQRLLPILALAGMIGSAYGQSLGTPVSSFMRPADTTAYGVGDLIASSTTAGSIVVPSISIPFAGNAAIIPRVRLSTNATTGWGATLTVTLWTKAPTYSSGDNTAYSVATGAASKVSTFSCVLLQYGDGAAGPCLLDVGNVALVKIPDSTTLYWDLQTTSALTPISGQTFTLTTEILN
jgi:hypothetical protein